MTLSINQILVICLILVLVVFLIEVGIMAAHAIALMKKSKGLVETSNKAVEDVKGRADNISDGLTTAISNIAEDTNPAIKVLAGVAAGLTAVNSIGAVGKGLAIKSGVMAAIVGNRDAKKAKKEIKRSKKTVKQLKKQARIERAALRQSSALERKAIKYEAAVARKLRKAQLRAEKSGCIPVSKSFLLSAESIKRMVWLRSFLWLRI